MEINTNYYERETLAALIMSQDAQKQRSVISKLSIDMFASRFNKTIYSAIKELSEEASLIDVISVQERAAYLDAGNSGITLSDVAEMIQGCLARDSAMISYAKKVRQSFYLRDAQKRLQSGIDLIQNLPDISKIGEVSSEIERLFSGMTLETNDQLPVPFKEVAKNYLDQLNDKINGKASDHIVLSNIPELDEHTQGFNNTDLITIGGLSGSGKTEFAVKLMTAMTGSDGGALIFSLEMSNFQVVERAVSSNAMIPVSSLRDPKRLEMNDGWQKMTTAMGGLISQDIHMLDQSNMNINDIVSISRAHKNNHPNLKGIFLDHIGLMELIGGASGRHDLQVGEISKKLKQLAKELKTPVFMLTQLTGKQVMQRAVKDRVPRAQDIKDSSRCEEDSDLILLTHRQKTHDESAPDIAEIVFSKARHAIKGTKVYFNFRDGHFMPTNQAMAHNTMDSYYNARSNAENKKNF